MEDDVKFRKLTAVSLAGMLALAACGDDSDNDSTSTGEATGEEIAAPDTEVEAELRVWLNGSDTPDEMRQLAIDTFNETYPNVEVNIETQDWDGLTDRLTNVLPTSDSPDIVEMGNTQIQQFSAAGALVDLTAHREDLGGDDLLDSLADAGTYDEAFYGLPLYAGARTVVYRTDLFDASDLEVPTTMQEYIDAGMTLQEDNSDVPNFSGIYFPGRNWHAMLAHLWDAGGDIAVQEDGEWVGQLTTAESIEGLESVQDIMVNANSAPADTDDSHDWEDFCAGEIGMLPAPGWKIGQIMDEADGCPGEMDGKLGVFALPGTDDELAPAFLGGSNVGISASSENQELALEFLKVLAGEEFQTAYAENGLIPARKSLLDAVEGDEATEAQAAAASNSRFIPSSEYWAEVESQEILHDMGTAIGNGADVEEEAQRANDAIEEILNQ